ncbi:MAG: UTP--glucose-1-phosphate uridylyltransferase GalU [Nitrospirota bacterium]
MIPAAGLGTRFLPATKASPKEMLPLVDKPIIQYVVEEAVAAGITEIIIVTGRGKRAIEDHFDAATELEQLLKSNGKVRLLLELQRLTRLANICYVRQPHPKGLGNAILCAEPFLRGEPFAVLLGDDVIATPVPAILQLMKIYERFGRPVVAVQPVERKEVRRYGVIKGRMVDRHLYEVSTLVEKPAPSQAPSRLGIIGRYVLTPSIFGWLRTLQPGHGGEIQLTDALRQCAMTEGLFGWKLIGQRYDAGDKLGFLKATVELGLKHPELGRAFRQFLQRLPAAAG